MNHFLSKYIVYFLVLYSGSNCYAQRMKDKMYRKIEASACFRRLNATHQTGCTSHNGGSTGVIHFIENDSDLDFILANGTAPPYIPVLPLALFSKTRVHQLKKSSKISGIVLYDSNVTLSHFSHESVCPNERYGLENSCKNTWNPFGTGLLHEDFPFPIFYLKDGKEIEPIKDCFVRFNNFSYDTQHQRPLCSLELKSFMFATTDTPTCIRRSNSKTNLNPVKFCDPLGAENVWASLFPIKNATKSDVTKDMSYIIVATRLDSTSLFRDVVPGAVNPVSGIVALLATAHLLKYAFSEDENAYDTNVLYMLFNGETYDYIGSQRMVYDMEKGDFPFKTDGLTRIYLNQTKYFIELSQLALSKGVYAHALRETEQISDFISVLKSNSNGPKLYPIFDVLPPASAQSFIKASPNISAIVLTNHLREYTNKFYNSMFDNVTNIGYEYYNVTDNDMNAIPKDSLQQYITDIAEALSGTIYEEISGKKFPNEDKRTNMTLKIVDELFNCFLLDNNCKIHSAIQRKIFDKEFKYNFDVSVSVSPSLVTQLIGLMLGWLSGVIVGKNDSTCKTDSETVGIQYFNMSESIDNLNKTVCFRTTLNFSEAVSPAFIISDYDWKSAKYSSWAESTWHDLAMRMFLKPSAAHEAFTLAVGSMVLVFSIIIVYFVKSRSQILFGSSTHCSPTSC